MDSSPSSEQKSIIRKLLQITKAFKQPTTMNGPVNITISDPQIKTTQSLLLQDSGDNSADRFPRFSVLSQSALQKAQPLLG